MITLTELLELVGELDDRPLPDSARNRFRTHLQRTVVTTGSLRDYVEECLRTKGSQQCRALQDLLNHAGRLIGFDVEFGRYQGTTNEIGFDGLWIFKDRAFVVEIKTTDAFAIKTAVLIGYLNELISAGRIKSADHLFGIYIVGRTDAGLSQIEASIVAEKRSNLRIATIDSILTLAELKEEELITTEEVVSILEPHGPNIDTLIALLGRISGQSAVIIPKTGQVDLIIPTIPNAISPTTAGNIYLIAPVRNDEFRSAVDCIDELLSHSEWAFSDRTPGRKKIKQGDRICFYAQGVGVVASAIVASLPREATSPRVKHPERYRWLFSLKEIRKFLEAPVIIDSGLRSQLDYFKGRNPEAPWAWFVQTTREISEADFHLLTKQGSMGAVHN